MPDDYASAEDRLYRLFVRDLVLPASIGVFPHEREARQRVRINIDLAVEEPEAPAADDLRRVVSYVPLVEAAQALVAAGHVNLVETLAERLAAACLDRPRARRVRVRVEKLDIFPDAESAGVEIERVRPGSAGTG